MLLICNSSASNAAWHWACTSSLFARVFAGFLPSYFRHPLCTALFLIKHMVYTVYHRPQHPLPNIALVIFGALELQPSAGMWRYGSLEPAAAWKDGWRRTPGECGVKMRVLWITHCTLAGENVFYTGGPKEDWLRKVNMVWFTTVGSTKIVQNQSKPKFIPKLPKMIPKSSKTFGREEAAGISWSRQQLQCPWVRSSVQLVQTVFEILLTDSHLEHIFEK